MNKSKISHQLVLPGLILQEPTLPQVLAGGRVVGLVFGRLVGGNK